MSFNETNKEGIFSPKTISKDASYTIQLAAKRILAQGKIVVGFATGLSNAPAVTQPDIPSPTTLQVIDTIELTTSWQEFDLGEIIANDNYAALWIFALDGPVLLDDVGFVKSCCEPFKIWQNIVDPPNTYVNNFIRAGENVDTALTSGEVVITANGESVLFQAGQSIDLEPGFRTETGAMFRAEIKPCSETPLSVEISEIGLIDPTSKPARCFRQYSALACYGSGQYKYEWLGIAQRTTFPIIPSITNLIPTDQERTITIRVVDIVFNDTVLNSVIVPKDSFHGNFDISLINFFSGVLGGETDPWDALDSSMLGSDTFGYNAYWYKLEFFDRWDIRLHSSESTDTSDGFAFDEINWIDDQCDNYGSGIYYGIINLENCTSTETIEFTATLACSSGSSMWDETNGFTEGKNGQVQIQPNPASIDNSFELEYPTDECFTFKLFNNMGQLIQEGESIDQTHFKLEGIARGVYYVMIISENKILGTNRVVVY